MNSNGVESLILPADQLRNELVELGFQRVNPPRDPTLVCPTLDWLREFGQWVKFEHEGYIEDSWDCDDFAMWAVIQASKGLLRNKALRGHGHAFLYATLHVLDGGILNGIQGPSNHACNIVRSQSSWHFFEPQNGTFREAQDALENLAVGSLYFALL